MKYEFVHKLNSDWCFEELNIIDQTLAFISNPIVGDPFVAVGKYLASIIAVKYLIIGRTVLPAAEKVRTVCFLNYGRQLENMTYTLKDTPCQHVIDYGVCYYPIGIQAEFPGDHDLTEKGIESYMGTALNDRAGNKIGLIVLLSEKTIGNPGFIEHLLTIVSPLLEQQLVLTEAEAI